MQINGEFTLKLSVYEVVALRTALRGLDYRTHQQSGSGLTLGQMEATNRIYQALDNITAKGYLVDVDLTTERKEADEEAESQ